MCSMVQPEVFAKVLLLLSLMLLAYKLLELPFRRGF